MLRDVKEQYLLHLMSTKDVSKGFSEPYCLISLQDYVARSGVLSYIRSGVGTPPAILAHNKTKHHSCTERNWVMEAVNLNLQYSASTLGSENTLARATG